MDSNGCPGIALLVSVRSAEEAEAALAGGADWIDVKEPARGSLGRPADAVVQAVLASVAGRRSVSAALGELAEHAFSLPAQGVALVKVGLAGWGGSQEWKKRLIAVQEQIAGAGLQCGVVPVAYADWPQAKAPPPQKVAEFARGMASPALLIDTWTKDGRTLLDWLDEAAIERLRDEAGLPLALAGSLGMGELAAVCRLRPAWLAVRGAVCRGGRAGRVEAALVAALVKSLRRPTATRAG